VITDADVRRAVYYSVLGAPPAGVTYGAHGIWYWSRKAEVPLDHSGTGVALPWYECLVTPAPPDARDARHPGPDGMVEAASGPHTAGRRRCRRDFSNYIQAARSEDGSSRSSICQVTRW